jgi:hypothetical protein
MGNQSKNNFKSFEIRIKELQQEIELLEELIPIYEYFKLTTRYQNSYIVEVRKIVAKELFNRGISYSEIGRALGRNHASIMHLMVVENTEEIQKETSMHYKDWMKNKLCPITYGDLVPSDIHKTGVKSVIKYKLKQLV